MVITIGNKVFRHLKTIHGERYPWLYRLEWRNINKVLFSIIFSIFLCCTDLYILARVIQYYDWIAWWNRSCFLLVWRLDLFNFSRYFNFGESCQIRPEFKGLGKHVPLTCNPIVGSLCLFGECKLGECIVGWKRFIPEGVGFLFLAASPRLC